VNQIDILASKRRNRRSVCKGSMLSAARRPYISSEGSLIDIDEFVFETVPSNPESSKIQRAIHIATKT